MYNSRVNGTSRVPADSSSGLLIASNSSTSPSGKFSITTFSGFKTAMRRSDVRFKFSRKQCSSNAISDTPSNFVTPIRSQNSRIASAV